MKRFSRLSTAAVVSAAILLLFGSNLPAEEPAGDLRTAAVSPMDGTLMLVGKGPVSRRSKDTFSFLAGEQQGRLVVITTDARHALSVPLEDWEQRIGSVTQIVQDVSLDPIDSATAVWIEQAITDRRWQTRLHRKLQDLLARGGSVGGVASGATSLATDVFKSNQSRDGLSLLPNSIIHCTDIEEDTSADESVHQWLKQNPVRIVWTLPPRSLRCYSSRPTDRRHR